MTETQSVQTIEQSGKKYKAMMLASVLVMLGSCGAFCNVSSDPNYQNTGKLSLTALVWCLGLFGWVGAKIGRWWNHG